MAWLPWLTAHWLDFLQSVGIVGGLSFTAWTLHLDARTRRATNLLTLTGQHRDLWMTLLTNPKLVSVLDDKRDLQRQPPTDEESRFVGMVILHLNGAYHAIKADVLTRPEGLAADIRSFLDLPIPYEVWKGMKGFFDADFITFVEANKKASPGGEAVS